MRVLLDTNILIHREAAYSVHGDIGVLFNWLDKLGHVKCIHPLSQQEVKKHQDTRVRLSFSNKLASYQVLQTVAPMHPEVAAVAAKQDRTENDAIDTALLNELYCGRVGMLVSEDKGIHRKAALLGVADRIFTINSFLEKAQVENPALADYRMLAVRKALFGHVDLRSPFFDSFREDYPGFDQWFNGKSDEPAYICERNGELEAFLFLKVENEREPYHDIEPRFPPKRRLKIGTLKVALNGYRLGERFLKIVFDNAVRQRVDEVYVTIFPKRVGQKRLIALLEEFGFRLHGKKGADEDVYVRDMTPRCDRNDPAGSYPYFGSGGRSFIVPIYPEYHTSLFPDSILNTESPDAFVELEPHRNAIRKVYVSRSINRDLRKGDVVVFYRTGGYHLSVVTTIGIIDDVHLGIANEQDFISLCRKRSVFTDDELRAHWNYRTHDRPFVVDFLYTYSFPSRPNLAKLIEHHVIANVGSAPRGFEPLTRDQLSTILSLAQADPRLAVDTA